MNARDQIRADREHATSDTLCACGCGSFTKRGRGVGPNSYIRGHARRGRKFSPTAERPHAHQFKGGRRINRDGYVLRLMPDHPRASHRYVGEHILIAEAALGKPLASEHPVHHVDHDRSNNRNSNLVICQDTAYHALLHRRERALLACGNPDARPCGFCSEHDSTCNMVPWGNQGGYAHRACAAEYGREHRARQVAS